MIRLPTCYEKPGLNPGPPVLPKVWERQPLSFRARPGPKSAAGSSMARGGPRPTYERLRDAGPGPEDPRVQAIVHHVDIVEELFQNEVAGRANPGRAIAYLSETNRQRLRDAGASWPELGS